MKTFNGLGFLIIILAFLVIIGSVSELQAAQDLMPVWNQRVDPATHPGAMTRSVKPVTWEDLKGDFSVPIIRYTATNIHEDKSFDINIEGFKGYAESWDYYDLAGARCVSGGCLAFANNSKEVIDYLAEEDIFLMSAIGPGSWTLDGWFTNPYPGLGSKVPDDIHKYILEKMPNRFGGWEFSEEDDRYVLASAWRMPEYPVTRKQGYQYYMGFVRRHCDNLQDYIVSMQNTIFAPYMADFQSVRLFGGQMPEHKHNISMWSSLLRGASKQYGVLWWPNITSCNNPLGTSKSYNETDMKKEGYSWGLSLSLLRRTANLLYMYGASAVQLYEPLAMLPHLNVEHNGKKITVDSPTPVARSHMEFKKWVAKHPDRGVMYTPVAMIWDFYAGWDTPSKYGRRRPFTVWGNLPYEKGDHQIDMFYRLLFPGYQDATFLLNEEGYLTPTPCGDIADVLMSNVPRFVLNQYNAAVVLGETRIEGQLKDTIEDFINRGGSVVTSVSNLTDQSAVMFGVKLTGKTKEKERYVQLLDKGKARGVFRDINEHQYTLHIIEPQPGTDILAINWYGDPVVISKKTKSGGQLLLFAADYGLSNRVGEAREPRDNKLLRKPYEIQDGRFDERIGTPYMMLEHVQTFLKPWLRQWNIINVQGPNIQYLTNVTENEKKVIVTLVNNQPDTWEGLVSFKNANLVKANSWMDDVLVNETSNGIAVTIKPHDMVVVDMYADKPVVTFKNNDITPEPDSKEIQRVSDSLIADMDKYSPQGMLAMKAPSYSKQAQEQPKPLYVNAWLFEDVAPEKWVPQIKKLGINGVEVKATTLYRPEFKNIWSLLKKEGMTVGAVHAGPDLVPFNFGVISSDDPDFIEPVLAWLEKTMEVMADAGIPRLVLYPGYKTRVIYIDQKISHAGSHTPESLKRLCRKAEELGLEIIIESAPYQLYQKPEDLVKLAKDINSPALKLGFDTGATAMIHNGNDIESNLVKTLNSLTESELLEYVHLSDLRHHPNGTLVHNHKPLGEGIIPENAYKKMLSICHDINKPVSLYLLVSKEEPLKALEKSLRMIGKL